MQRAAFALLAVLGLASGTARADAVMACSLERVETAISPDVDCVQIDAVCDVRSGARFQIINHCEAALSFPEDLAITCDDTRDIPAQCAPGPVDNGSWISIFVPPVDGESVLETSFTLEGDPTEHVLTASASTSFVDDEPFGANPPFNPVAWFGCAAMDSLSSAPFAGLALLLLVRRRRVAR